MPSEYYVAYDIEVLDCDLAETLIHQELASCRTNEDREFFRLSLKEAATVVEEIAKQVGINNEAIHIDVGLRHVYLGRYNEAIESFEQAIRIKHSCEGAHYQLGLSCLAVGNKKAALEQYEVLKSLNASLANRLFNSISRSSKREKGYPS